ncbi:MAG: hypothetical protein H7251_17580 [Acetobacteraceae bacterium]|nr:hypothetical protein [Acetobacteraceae bacterium]
MVDLPANLSRAESDQLKRRRRGRNWAMLLSLVALAVLFYAIAVVKMSVNQ